MKKSSNPIHINPTHKGDLHTSLHVPQGEKIPTEKLQKALHSENPHLKKMAVFARNAAHWSGK